MIPIENRFEMRVDTHSHTTASDGKGSLEEMVEKAISEDFDVFSITNHVWSTDHWERDLIKIRNEFYKASDFLERRSGDILVIPGVEITVPKWHMILLGVDFGKLFHYLSRENIDPFALENILTWADSNGVFSIAAHPLAISNVASLSEKKMRKNLNLLSGAEVHNGEFRRRMPSTMYNAWSEQAESKVREMGLIPFCGSDAHKVKDVGMGTVVSVNQKLTIETSTLEVLALIKSGSGFRPILPAKNGVNHESAE